MSDFKSIIGKAAAGTALSREEARAAFDIMMSGEATPSQIGGFLMALRVRGETVDEITGAVEVMREKMTRVEAPADAIDEDTEAEELEDESTEETEDEEAAVVEETPLETGADEDEETAAESDNVGVSVTEGEETEEDEDFPDEEIEDDEEDDDLLEEVEEDEEDVSGIIEIGRASCRERV